MNWFCYILRCTDENNKNLTYNGKTNDIVRRLKQHNGELKGGAKATKGKKWEVYMLMKGFPDEHNALSCEWRIKHPTKSKKRPQKYCGVNGRIYGMNEVLKSEKWTNNTKHLNSENNYKLFITEDVLDILDINAIPDNIEIFKVKRMGSKFLKNIMENKY